MKAIAKVIAQSDDQPQAPIDENLFANAGNDKPLKPKKMLEDRVSGADREWSNYPTPLPPQMNCHTVYAVREALEGANNKDLMDYYSEPDKKQVEIEIGGKKTGKHKVEVDLATIGQDYELGILECYDGISQNDEGNFLSCDCLNQEYMDDVVLRLKYKDTAEAVLGARKPLPTWNPHNACFVYAPPGTILSDTDDVGNKALIQKETAQENWKKYASHKVEPSNKNQSPNVNSADLMSNFWCYQEEFVDVVNEDMSANKKHFQIKEKGRICFMFPVQPLDIESDSEEKNSVLALIKRPTDSIGWGVVTEIAGVDLPEDYQPTSWDDLQKLVGRYILLTSLWSSSPDDTYKVIVDNQVLKGIYNRVRAMTKGDMIVNVRRGQHAYGRLCVLQKQITLDPSEDHYGLPETDKAESKSTIWMTQIFMSVNSLTPSHMEGERKKITSAFRKHDLMSIEEKILTNIFQMTNNKIITCMKTEQYRTIMEAYWQDDPRNAIALMGSDRTWNMNTMKAMLITMLSTEYDIFFQKIPTKMSCKERTERFMNVFKYYKNWFMERKCMATNEFVAKYERMLAEEAIKPAQFSGMPTQYIDHSQIPETEGWKKKKPEIKLHDSEAKKNVLDKTTVTKGPGLSTSVQAEMVKREVEQKVAEMKAKMDEEIKVNFDREVRERLKQLAAQKNAKEASGKPATEAKQAVGEEGLAVGGPSVVDERDGDASPSGAGSKGENAGVGGGIGGTGAFIGQNTDSFSERLARLQDW